MDRLLSHMLTENAPDMAGNHVRNHQSRRLGRHCKGQFSPFSKRIVRARMNIFSGIDESLYCSLSLAEHFIVLRLVIMDQGCATQPALAIAVDSSIQICQR